MSQNLPPTAVHPHAWMGRFDQTDKLDEPGVVWPSPPRPPAPSRGYSVAESVGKSRWAGGRQALCAAGPGPRVSERLEWIHLCRRPAPYPGPTHPSRSPRHGACGLALRRSLNLPLGSELKVQKWRGLKYRGVHPGTRDIQPQDGTSAVPVTVVTQQPRLTQAEGARPRAALGSQGPSLGETSIRQPPGGHQSLAPQHLLFPAFTQSVLFTQVLCSCRHFERQRSKRAPLLPGQAGHTPALEPRGSSALPCSVLAVCVCVCVHVTFLKGRINLLQFWLPFPKALEPPGEACPHEGEPSGCPQARGETRVAGA